MLQLIDPPGKYLMPRHTVDRAAVIGHLRLVLNAFANKPEYTKFYIGITNDVSTRLQSHRGSPRGGFRLMVPIYEEQPLLVENSFDNLEQEAINTFRRGILNLQTKKVLKCDNGPNGAPPKITLYILVG